MKQPLIECVPNFSEGKNKLVIDAIVKSIAQVEGIKVLNVDMGAATNRTVVTFVGSPESVVEAAFQGIKTAGEMIDMRYHKGEHPRMGATDVCPLVPIRDITMEETVEYAKQLAKKVGEELKIPVYLYEYAQTKEYRKNLSVIRAGEYEGFFDKIKLPEWKPDFGPDKMDAKRGATVIGARKILIAYNVNLNTTSVRRANSVAFDVREAGRVLREGGKPNGKIIYNEDGTPKIQPGMCKAVKAIGWYIEEYGIAQVSMNLTDIDITPLHKAFEACCISAEKRGLRVTGSELVGLVPLKSLLDAGKYFLKKQGLSAGLSEKELIHIAVKSLGLDELKPFVPEERIIEYLIKDKKEKELVNKTVSDFVDITASESPAPGGGSVSALCGALGAALGAMVANLSANKKGWENQTNFFSEYAEKLQDCKNKLITLIDKDTQAFNEVMKAFSLPKNTEEEKNNRKKAIDTATYKAMMVPFETMQVGMECMDILKIMAEKGNPNSVSDAGVGAMCIRTAVLG
ncbi:MAG: glutamate formimidoyltransferase, partial [Bacteroidia bacterium]|nr:glutamate formimidoyltransferase [Bacteroidia bacterium]